MPFGGFVVEAPNGAENATFAFEIGSLKNGPDPVIQDLHNSSLY